LAITRPPSSSTVHQAVIVVSALKLFQLKLFQLTGLYTVGR
jgi:hypothetical protein